VEIRTCRAPMSLRRGRTEATARRSAFTLIELLAVIAILGMFASVATVVVRGSISAARHQLDWQRLRSMDVTLRAQCRRLKRPATLQVDLDTGNWERHMVGMQSLRLIETTSLDEVSNRGQVVRTGQATLFYRADGTSDSYAVRLNGDIDNQWRLSCGGSGQWVEGVSRDTVRALQRVQ
jgi:prepilin-type N-terminal cleavage/methylation domain-containing protein